MDILWDDGATRVELSRRNLEDLLRLLDHVGKRERAYLYRMTDNGMLYVYAAENEDHYTKRQPGPGADAVLRNDKLMELAWQQAKEEALLEEARASVALDRDGDVQTIAVENPIETGGENV